LNNNIGKMMITERIAAKETREDTSKKLLFYGAGPYLDAVTWGAQA
jgi:hypothetical protein